MGSFYTSITLRGPDQDQVAGALRQQGRTAYVSPTVEGFTVVCDQQCEMQDVTLLEALAAALSRQFQCPALAVLNHDDDVLLYRLYDGGKLLGKYNSTPGYFTGRNAKPSGGDADKLCAAMGAPQNVEAVKEILHKAQGTEDNEYLFAIGRHEDLGQALGLPPFSPGLGYTYLAGGDLFGVDVSSFQHVGTQETPE